MTVVSFFAKKLGNLAGFEATVNFQRPAGHRLPANTKGYRAFLTKANGAMSVKGAYAVLRLYCQAPELAGKTIDDISDRVANSKEGVDLVLSVPTSLPGTGGKVPEFWEIKHGDSAANVSAKQIDKHISTKVAAFYQELRDRGLTTTEIRQVMSKVKLRFDVIAPGAGDALRRTLHGNVNDILDLSFQALKDAGFRFDLADIFMRKADPLQTPLTALPNPL